MRCFETQNAMFPNSRWDTTTLAAWDAGLEKVLISPWLVTLLHIYGVTPNPQLLISPETPHQPPILSHRMKSVRVFHDVLRVFHDVLLVIHNVLRCITMFFMCFMMFYYVQQCFMFSESRTDRCRRSGDRAAAERLRDRDNAAGIGDNSAEIGDGATGIVDIAVNVVLCWTPSWMETGVTLFLGEKFQKGWDAITQLNILW